MKTKKITIGDSTTGYTHATVNVAETGRYTLVAGSVEGIKRRVVAAIKALNAGNDDVDGMPIYVKAI
jgi:hypothetical protein